MDKKIACKIVDAIIADIRNRQGFDDLWGEVIDEGADGEIRDEWVELVTAVN